MLARLATGYRRPSDCPSVKLSGPKGNRTLLTDLARICRPLGTCQPISEVRPGIEPGLRPYHRRVLPQHLQTLSISDRGWNRTIDLLHVTQTSSPLDHAIVLLEVVETGLEPAKSQASHACRFACCVLDRRK